MNSPVQTGSPATARCEDLFRKALRIPHAIAAVYDGKIKNDGRAHVVVFGYGATEEGVYFETINFAALQSRV